MRRWIAIAWFAGVSPAQCADADLAIQVRAIFDDACIRCHGAKKPKSGFRLDNRSSALRGGDIGVSIIPGRVNESALIRYIRHAEEDLEMPPVGKGDKLSEAEIDVVSRWINAGAAWPERQTTIHFSASPAIRIVSVAGNERRFREHTGMREGVTGGVSEFSLTSQLDANTRLEVDGHAIAELGDYAIDLDLTRHGVGFIHAGASEWTRFYDNVGGVQPGAALPAPLRADLKHKLGRAWMEFGIEPPDGPNVSLDYEYLYQDGAKSMLTWGNSGGIGLAPSFKEINEDIHRLKLDFEHEWKDTKFTDEFRLEFQAFNNEHFMQGDVLNGTASTTSARNRTDQYIGANTFRVEREIRDGWYATAAYHHSQLRADNSLRVESTTGGALATGPQWQANSILTKSQTHAFSISSLLGPWNHLSLAPTFQAEWNRRRSAGGADIGYVFFGPFTAVPIALTSSRDERITSEALTLRYTGIQSVVVSAEARLRQEEQGIFEQQTGGDTGFDPLVTKNPSFLQRTDGDGSTQNYHVGLRYSPQPGWAFSTRFRHRFQETGYLNEQLAITVPAAVGIPVSAFPGFIRWWKQETDEAQARITARIRRGWRANLTYQVMTGNYTIATDSAPADPAGGGQIDASSSDAHTISLGSTITPNHRWHLAANASFTDSRTTSAANNVAAVTAWRGQSISTYAHAGFVLNERTDLACTYSFSQADFAQPTAAGRVVAGTDYTLHGLRTGIGRRLGKDMKLRWEYGFNKYHEPTAQGQNDYTAHGIFAALTLPWPGTGFAEQVAAEDRSAR